MHEKGWKPCAIAVRCPAALGGAGIYLVEPMSSCAQELMRMPCLLCPVQVERGVASFWQGVAGAAPAAQARLERRSAAGEALPAGLEGAAEDRWAQGPPWAGWRGSITLWLWRSQLSGLLPHTQSVRV